MSKFKYRERTTEDVQRRAKQSSGRYDSYVSETVTWFRPRSGENCIRLIPWLDQNDKDFEKYDKRWGNHWGIDIIFHRNVGPANGTYLCLDKMRGESCPICDAWRSDDLAALVPVDRVLCWLIDRNNEKAGPQLWAMPLTVSKDISVASQEKGTGQLLLIDHWDEGYDVFFDTEGEKKLTQYKRVSVDRKSTPLADDVAQQDDWLDYVFGMRLPDILKYYDTDYLDKVLSGQKERNDDDGHGDTSDRRRSRGEAGDREETSSRVASSRSREDYGRGDADISDRRSRSDTNGSRRRAAEDAEPAHKEPENKEPIARRRLADDDTEVARGRLENVGRRR